MAKKQDKSKIVQIWGEIIDEGFTTIPNILLHHRSSLGLKTHHTMFIIDVMSFKWDEENPFPSYSALAKRSKLSIRHTMRMADELVKMGLLIKTQRFNEDSGAQMTTTFDFRPLVQRLIKASRLERGGSDIPITRGGGDDIDVRGGDIYVIPI